MTGGTAASSSKAALRDSLYGGSRVRTSASTITDTSCPSGDYSSPGSPSPPVICQDDNMLLSSMIPPSHSNNIVSMRSHVFSTFRSSQSKVASSTSASSHTCRVCAKTFRASSLLDIHMRVHVGAKPFVCPICGHRATQKGNLKLHMKKHHGADLPPHIDLVPDSGIWGHPQENILCSSSTQLSEGIDNSIDSSGKRKQVAQAVSSLLNEEVVELIKKYQNDVGQGTTGTITESLEDFIRIAKNKSGAGSSNLSSESERPKKGRDGLKKKRLALSLRFQPYPECLSSKKATSYSPVSNVAELDLDCAICGKSYRPTSLEKLQICQECLVVQSHANSLHVLQAVKEEPVDCEINSDLSRASAVATINNVPSEELRKHAVRGWLATCSTCGGCFLDGNLERHKKQCHSSKLCVTVASRKEQFFYDLGLVSKPSSTSNKENTSNSLTDLEGLNPLLGQVVHIGSKYDRAMQLREDNFEKCRVEPNEMKQASVVEEKVEKSIRAEREVSTPSPIRRRASPGVLKMLRQTLLNSADQKESVRQNSLANSDELSPRTSREGAEFRENSIKDSYHYRNPAMQSLAEIGKSMNFSHIFAASKSGSRTRTSDWLKSNIAERHDHEGNGYKCPYCPKWFKYRSVLEIHVRSHTGERPYKCPYCDYAGTQHNCLKLHIQRHHPTKNPNNNVSSGGTHHVGSSSRPSTPDLPSTKGSCFSPVNCPVCGRVSPSPGYLKIHMRSHKKSLDHVCHVCGRGFKEYWYLSTHLKTHERELSSLKFNLQQYNTFHSQSKTSVNSRLFDSQFLLKKFAASLVAENASQETSLKPRILKHEPMSTRHIYASAGSEQHDYRSEAEHKNSTTVPKDYAKLNDEVEKGVIGSRSRRRKASCPSRVVSSPYTVPKSPIWRSTQSLIKATETYCHEDTTITQNANSTFLEDESPLDLRCPAKKMSDKASSDLPANLSKA